VSKVSALAPNAPPRKREDASTGEEPLPLDVVFLDPERRMPVLIPTRKAA
jgi:hypothetical protein